MCERIRKGALYHSIPELNNILKFNGFKGEFFGSFPSYENSQSKGFLNLEYLLRIF